MPKAPAKPAKAAPAPAKKATKATPAPLPKKATEAKFAMPLEVKNWIERAQSIMGHQKGEIERLKTELAELKAYKKWAEHRILRSDYE